MPTFLVFPHTHWLMSLAVRLAVPKKTITTSFQRGQCQSGHKKTNKSCKTDTITVWLPNQCEQSTRGVKKQWQLQLKRKLFQEEKSFLNKHLLFSRLMAPPLLVILFFSRPTDAVEKVFERNVPFSQKYSFWFGPFLVASPLGKLYTSLPKTIQANVFTHTPPPKMGKALIKWMKFIVISCFPCLKMTSIITVIKMREIFYICWCLPKLLSKADFFATVFTVDCHRLDPK